MENGKRVNVVTGARSGMGRAVTELLRGRGEHVVGLDLLECDVNADLSSTAGRRQAIADIERLLPGGFDALIECAGTIGPDGSAIVAVNYFGTVALAEGLLPLLQKGRSPRVVVISSSAYIYEVDDAIVEFCKQGDEEAARRAAEHSPLAYSCSKRALSRWIRRTAVSPGWADTGVLLNGVVPGAVRTPMIEHLLLTEESRKAFNEHTPRVTSEIATPEDVAFLLAYLASPENRQMVGQIPFIDGGTDVLRRGEAIE